MRPLDEMWALKRIANALEWIATVQAGGMATWAPPCSTCGCDLVPLAKDKCPVCEAPTTKDREP